MMSGEWFFTGHRFHRIFSKGMVSRGWFSGDGFQEIFSAKLFSWDGF
jgi:hypothetical protein